MICPICQKRKAKRFCPARGDSICSVCCGTEREVSIDCPSECPHLIESRAPDYARKEIDWTKLPFRETKIDRSLLTSRNKGVLTALAYAICTHASENRPLVDSDVEAALSSLVDTYRTLASGIYYEKPPDYRLQRELYERLRTAVDDYRKEETRGGLATLRDADVRELLIFLAQLGYARSNGRPKGRAFLDLLRREFTSGEFDKSDSKIVLLP